MKRPWCVIYGAMIVFFVAFAIAIPNQSIPWVSTAIMTCTAMMWHRAQAASWQAFVAMKAHAACWRGVAYEAMHERDVLIELARDGETNCERPTVNTHTQYHEKFGEVLAEINRRVARNPEDFKNSLDLTK